MNTIPTTPADNQRAEHTPTPWDTRNPDELSKADKRPAWETIIQRDYRDVAIARIFQSGANGLRQSECEANAKFVVQACNSHAALVAALERVLHPMASDDDMEFARDALASAKG
jgi:hypothetical protein